MRFIIRILVLLLIESLFHSSSLAATSTGQQALFHLLQNIRTLQADFTQQVYNTKNKQVLIAHGNLALAQPGHFRWEVTSPSPQLVIASSTRLFVYDPDLAEVTIQRLTGAITKAPAFLFFQNQKTLAQNFNIHATHRADHDEFELIPKKTNDLFTTLRLHFYRQQLHQLSLKDHLGQATIIQFQHIQQNKPLSKKRFVFHIPPNVEVIEEKLG